MDALGPLETYTCNHQLHMKGNVPQGTYFAGAIVDYIDEYDWYDFPSATDTKEYVFPEFITVTESNEEDNVSPVLETTAVSGPVCVDDPYEDDDAYAGGTPLTRGDTQEHNLCYDNADWYSFEAVAGEVYQITTAHEPVDVSEVDTQLILYEADGGKHHSLR